MLILRPAAGEPIAIFGEDGKMLGTVKLFPNTDGRGKTGLAFDFPRSIRIDPHYGSSRALQVPKPSTFGDYDPPDYSVPEDADN